MTIPIIFFRNYFPHFVYCDPAFLRQQASVTKKKKLFFFIHFLLKKKRKIFE